MGQNPLKNTDPPHHGDITKDIVRMTYNLVRNDRWYNRIRSNLGSNPYDQIRAASYCQDCDNTHRPRDGTSCDDAVTTTCPKGGDTGEGRACVGTLPGGGNPPSADVRHALARPLRYLHVSLVGIVLYADNGCDHQCASRMQCAYERNGAVSGTSDHQANTIGVP